MDDMEREHSRSNEINTQNCNTHFYLQHKNTDVPFTWVWGNCRCFKLKSVFWTIILIISFLESWQILLLTIYQDHSSPMSRPRSASPTGSEDADRQCVSPPALLIQEPESSSAPASNVPGSAMAVYKVHVTNLPSSQHPTSPHFRCFTMILQTQPQLSSWHARVRYFVTVGLNIFFLYG